MAVIELITSEVCPFAQRAHMALIEKGLDFTVREVDLANKPAWFEEVSPYSKVPVVKIADEVVWESAIVNEFIDERFPETPLMPDSPWLRAQARIWIDYCNTHWVGDFYDLLSATEPKRQDELREKVMQDLAYMERGRDGGALRRALLAGIVGQSRRPRRLAILRAVRHAFPLPQGHHPRGLPAHPWLVRGDGRAPVGQGDDA